MDFLFNNNKNLILFVIFCAFLFLFIIPVTLPSILELKLPNLINTVNTIPNNFSNPNVIKEPNLYKLDKTKDYYIIIKTSKGNIKIDLFEKHSPKNVSNILSILDSYKDTHIYSKKGYLIQFNTSQKIEYNIEDEINTTLLGLDTKVNQANFLENLYNPNDNKTFVFAPANLNNYKNFSLEEFYSGVLGYTYNKNSEPTPKASKYMVYMNNSGPNTNKGDFFILMSNLAPEIDGRFTPIGRVIEGFFILDEINQIQQDAKVIEIIMEAK